MTHFETFHTVKDENGTVLAAFAHLPDVLWFMRTYGQRWPDKKLTHVAPEVQRGGVNLTPKEIEVLVAIHNSDYQNSRNLTDQIGHDVWTWSISDSPGCHLTPKQVAGVLVHLSEKGLVVVQDYDGTGDITQLTESGVAKLATILARETS